MFVKVLDGEFSRRSHRLTGGRSDPGLFADVRAAHVRLRELVANGLDDAIGVLAADVMELASETADVLEQNQGPSGS
jgi:hypothetical protein